MKKLILLILLIPVFVFSADRIIDSNYNIDFLTGYPPTEKARITSAGNVGIGVTPTQQLHQLSATRATHLLSGALATSGGTNGAATFWTDGATQHGIGHGNALYGNSSSDLYINAGNSKNISLVTASTERVKIDSAGAVNIQTGPLVNQLGAVGTPSYTFTGDANNGWWSPAADTQAWSTGGTERMRIDNLGKVGIGSPGYVAYTSGAVPNLSVDQSNNYSALAIRSWVNSDSHAGMLILGKSRTTTIGVQTQTSSGDTLGWISAEGVNTSSVATSAAIIKFEQDGAPGATFIPGRILFQTATSTSSSFTERMRIASNGYIGVAPSTSPVCTLSNTNTNIFGANAGGLVGTDGFAWAANAGGAVGGFYNASTSSGAHGLVAKIAGSASTNYALDVSQHTASATTGNVLFNVRGNAQIGVTTTNWATGGTAIGVSGGLLTTSPSSRRYKKNENTLSIDTSKIFNLTVKEFDYIIDDKHSFGGIAEDVVQILPEIVNYEKDGNGNPIPESISENKLSWLILVELKKLKTQNDTLKTIVCADHPTEQICQ